MCHIFKMLFITCGSQFQAKTHHCDNKRKIPNFTLFIEIVIVILKFLYEMECGAAKHVQVDVPFLRWERDSCIQLHYTERKVFVHESYACVLSSLTWITVYKQVFPWAIPFFSVYTYIRYQKSHKVNCRHFSIHTTKMR